MVCIHKCDDRSIHRIAASNLPYAFGWVTPAPDDCLCYRILCLSSIKLRFVPLSNQIESITVFPTAKCRLRLLKLERIKDFLDLEKEYIRNQEVFKVRWEGKGKWRKCARALVGLQV